MAPAYDKPLSLLIAGGPEGKEVAEAVGVWRLPPGRSSFLGTVCWTHIRLTCCVPFARRWWRLLGLSHSMWGPFAMLATLRLLQVGFKGGCCSRPLAVHLASFSEGNTGRT